LRFCLVTRELAPFGGGGIGVYVANLARILADAGQVTIITRAAHRTEHERRVAAGLESIDPRVSLRFVEEPPPEALGTYVDFHHAWSAAVLQELEACYGDRGPDLIEFPDYHAEGFATVQARRTGHRTLRDSRVVVRAHCSWELCTLLDGFLSSSVPVRAICDMERYAIRHADRFLHAGGDIHGTYLRFYGADGVAPATRVRHPLEAREPAAGDAATGYPLRFLYAGRLERRKGLLELVEGLMRNPSDAWTLTLVGGDTPTGPLGVSMRDELEAITAGDDRVQVLDPVPRDELQTMLEHHDVIAMPSTWECWPYAVLEALRAGRPVLATPTGGHVEQVVPGVSGWLSAGTSPDALGDVVDALLEDPDAARDPALRASARAHVASLADPDEIRASYVALARGPQRHRPPRPVAATRRHPLVSVVVPYRRTPDHLLEAIDSALHQTLDSLEVVVVNDGSLDPGDEVLAEAAARPRVRLVHQTNGGLGAARNFGVAVSSGRYIFALDADNVAEADYLRRAVELLEDDPSLAYVTCWSRYIDEHGRDLLPGLVTGYQPLGNFSAIVEEQNVAGDAATVWPRRLFDLGFRYSEEVPIVEDWMLWRSMRRAGRIGEVIPERLVRYRVRPGSMYRDVESTLLARLRDEMTTRLALEEMQWTSSSA
jgi:glycogen synthase